MNSGRKTLSLIPGTQPSRRIRSKEFPSAQSTAGLSQLGAEEDDIGVLVVSVGSSDKSGQCASTGEKPRAPGLPKEFDKTLRRQWLPGKLVLFRPSVKFGHSFWFLLPSLACRIAASVGPLTS